MMMMMMMILMMMMQIYQQLTSMSNVSSQWLAIGCFLVSNGADMHHKNHNNKSPVDEVADTRTRDLLQTFAKYIIIFLYINITNR